MGLPTFCLGNLIAFLSMALAGTSMRLNPGDVLPLLVLGLIFVPLAQCLLVVGARCLPSAESSLIMCLETVLSPILAASVTGEVLTLRSWMGGAIVIAALVLHTVCA